MTFTKARQRLIWIVLILVVWELSIRISGISPLLLPSVSSVIKALFHDLVYENLLIQSLSSILMIGLGLLISCVLALLLALLSERFVLTNSFIDTLITIAHPLPGLALLPLIIIWFGAGSYAVLAIVIHSALWPLLLNLNTGFSSVPEIYTDIGKNMGLTKSQISLEIKLRFCASYLISGLKIGWARAWRAFISAEMVFGALGNKGGLGWYLLNQRTFMKTDGLFAGIFVIIFLGIVIEDGLFAFLEQHTTKKWGMS